MKRSTRRKGAFVTWVALAAAIAPAHAQQVPQVPVMVGDDVPVDIASCSLAVVTGLDPQGDNFLAVRSGPGSSNAQIDALHTGDQVYVCDGNGRWMGVVYPTNRNMESGTGQCGVPAPVSPRQAYRGPCDSGWVYDAYIQIIAG